MLQFTKEMDYSLQLIMKLMQLKKGEVLSLRSFSKESNISFLFLQRIAKKLREAKMIEAVKGAYGGYTLAKDPYQITVKQIVDAIEGEWAVVECLKSACDCKCGCKQKCRVKKVFDRINHRLDDYLKGCKLEEFIRE